jgi:hypothetical protein
MATTVKNDQLIKTIETATMADALKYQATADKFVFCLDILELSLDEDGDGVCDHWVQQLENKFDSMLDV